MAAMAKVAATTRTMARVPKWWATKRAIERAARAMTTATKRAIWTAARAMAMAMKRAMVMGGEGNVDVGKGNGNGDKEGNGDGSKS
jgi:hypothetical protein